MAEFAGHDVEGETVRGAHDVRPWSGVDMGDGDAWPTLR
ncbi:NAD(P)H-dependent oxidoreductase [Streptomyces] [Streptomyces griseus]